MGSMWSETFPACKWFNSPTLLLPSLNLIGQTLPLCLCCASLNPGKRSSAWSAAYVAPLEGVKPSACAPRDSQHSLAGITVSPSLKWTPSISARAKGFSVDSCLISAFMLCPMCLAQTTWKPRGWLHGGGTKEHLRWTLCPMSSGVITGRDGSDGAAAENTQRSKAVLLWRALNQSQQLFPEIWDASQISSVLFIFSCDWRSTLRWSKLRPQREAVKCCSKIWKKIVCCHTHEVIHKSSYMYVLSFSWVACYFK